MTVDPELSCTIGLPASAGSRPAAPLSATEVDRELGRGSESTACNTDTKMIPCANEPRLGSGRVTLVDNPWPCISADPVSSCDGKALQCRKLIRDQAACLNIDAPTLCQLKCTGFTSSGGACAYRRPFILMPRNGGRAAGSSRSESSSTAGTWTDAVASALVTNCSGGQSQLRPIPSATAAHKIFNDFNRSILSGFTLYHSCKATPTSPAAATTKISAVGRKRSHKQTTSASARAASCSVVSDQSAPTSSSVLHSESVHSSSSSVSDLCDAELVADDAPVSESTVDNPDSDSEIESTMASISCSSSPNKKLPVASPVAASSESIKAKLQSEQGIKWFCHEIAVVRAGKRAEHERVVHSYGYTDVTEHCTSARIKKDKSLQAHAHERNVTDWIENNLVHYDSLSSQERETIIVGVLRKERGFMYQGSRWDGIAPVEVGGGNRYHTVMLYATVVELGARDCISRTGYRGDCFVCRCNKVR